MNTFCSGFADDLEKFVQYRRASGSWNEYASHQNLVYFDHYCVDNYGGAPTLTQEMIDSWCVKRDTETSGSCYTRTLPARQFVEYLSCRERTTVKSPDAPQLDKRKYIPHAFSDEELSGFFNACDNIVPYKNRPASVLRKIQCPAFFRLLYSSGIRTTEARYLRRTDVDLIHGVLNIQKSKGYDQHYVALHETMTEVLKSYDTAANKLQPDRTWFFQSLHGSSSL